MRVKARARRSPGRSPRPHPALREACAARARPGRGPVPAAR
jgi:hypothetical protein